MKHQRRRRLGQHFLVDLELAERIAELALPGDAGTLVEIGPGRGALTAPLLARRQPLEAVECDPALVMGLRRRWGEDSGLHLHEADALRFDFASLAQAGQKLHFTGNLPYSIATQLVFRLLRLGALLGDLLFMLQEEVALRICAAPGDKHYGRLSVMLQSRCQVELLWRVPPTAFRPPPRVWSAMLRLRPHDPEIKRPPALGELTRRAFSARRKTLRNALRGYCVPQDLEAIGLDPELRPQQVAVDDWLKLAVRMQAHIKHLLY